MEEVKKKTKKVNAKYVFNNCTVTVNEEGKAIQLLEKEFERKQSILNLIKMAGSFASFYANKNMAETEKKQPPFSAPKPAQGTGPKSNKK